MPRNYARKLEAMRAYGKTPAYKASKEKYRAKLRARREQERASVLNVNPAPLTTATAIANWRT